MDTENIPIPMPEEVASLLQAGEKIDCFFRGRVDGLEHGLDQGNVCVTLRCSDGGYSRAQLARALFSEEPHKDMGFILLVLSHQPSGYACRVHILPKEPIQLTEAEARGISPKLKDTAYVYAVVSEYIKTTPIRPMKIR